jgi:hypothetical protein
MHEGIDEVLSRHLRPVRAPEELWERIRKAPAAKTRSSFGEILSWATVAAAVALTILSWYGYHASQPMTLVSRDATEVRNWLRANSGFDGPLPAHPSELIEILGANIERAGKLIAKIRYRVGEVEAMLSVTKDEGGGAQHKNSQISSTWAMAGQFYTLALAGPGDIRAACILCHNPHEGVY